MRKSKDIYSYITEQETAFELPIMLDDSWEWGFKNHVRTCKLYKNSQIKAGKDDNTPVKNITRPIVNFQYRATGFDLKDIEVFVTDKNKYYKSFLIKKFFEKWGRLEGMDTFIDAMVESFIDYGGALVQDMGENCPFVVPLETIAFCDQTSILSGPIGIKHHLSPSELKEKGEAKGWGNVENGATGTIDDLIVLAEDVKVTDKQKGQQTKTPGKYIEVYEIHGMFPESWLYDDGNPDKYVKQLRIESFYYDEKGDKVGFCLFKGKDKKERFKFIARDAIFNRALGFSGPEELFDAQIWTNYGMIRMKELLDATAKTIYITTDSGIATRNKVDDMQQSEIVYKEDGKEFSQLETRPRSYDLFDRFIAAYEVSGKENGSANDPNLGKSPSAGTPFKLQDLVVEEGKGIHEYRKGKLARFTDEICRDWIIPRMVTKMTEGDEFLSELSLKELQEVAESLVMCETEKANREAVLSGKNALTPEELDLYKQKVRADFMRGGKKRFLKILKDEMKKAPVDVYTNIAGKLHDLSGKVDKMVNIFRQIIAAPEVLAQYPYLADLMNQILEGSGLSPVDFSPTGIGYEQQRLAVPGQQQQGASAQSTAPLQELSKNVA